MLAAVGAVDPGGMTKPQRNREYKQRPTTQEEDPAAGGDATAMKMTIW
jgi:hypothetical protein